MDAQTDMSTNYRDVAISAAKRILDGLSDRALLFSGTGLSVAPSANKVKDVRAVTAHDAYSIERSVLSNDVQARCQWQHAMSLELARQLVHGWICLSRQHPDRPPR